MSTRNIILGIVLFAVVTIVGSYFLVGGNKPEIKIVTYAASAKEKPVAELKKNLQDFGKIKVSDERKAQFTVKNAGSKPLQLYEMSSSCHCTFGTLTYKGKTSDEYGMSTISDVLAEIPPGESATVTAIYRPYVMPAYGPVEREVYLSTNDPAKPKLVFQLTANVQ